MPCGKQIRYTFVLIACLATACARDSIGPSGAGTQFVIRPQPASMLVGESARLTSVLTTPDGIVRHLDARWTTDDESVATIDRQGELKAVGPGIVGVVAGVDGLYARFETRVRSVFRGSWAGSLRMSACVPAGCTQWMGWTKPVRLSVTQVEDRIEGTIAISEGFETVVRTVAINGTMSVGGLATVHVASRASDGFFGSLGTIDMRITVDVNGPTPQLTGHVEETFISSTSTHYVWDLQNVNRVP